MKKIIVILVIMLGWVGDAFAQPDNAQVETIGGKKYYIHIVQQGNTLYGIQQLYNTSMGSILAENKGISDDLTIGQRVLIPIDFNDPKHYGKHTVVASETLYGISKKYECTVDDLKVLNPTLTEGLSIGQVLIVPKKSAGGQPGEVIQTDPVVRNNQGGNGNFDISMKDTIINHTVLPHETLYSIAKRYMVSADTIMSINGLTSVNIKKDAVLKIPIKNVNYKILEKDLTALTPKDSVVEVDKQRKFKTTYNVALLLPLMLDKNDAEMAKPIKVDQVREMFSTTKISFDFYQGFLFAADSMSKAGMNVEIFVYDTRRDTATITDIFNDELFKDIDLVIGPLYRNTINVASKLCAERKIRMVLPFNSDADVIYKNPYVYKGVASNMTLLDGAIDYIIANHKADNIILIKPIAGTDLALYERARERFNQKIKGLAGAYNGSIVETTMGSVNGHELNKYMKIEMTNIVIIPSLEMSFVSGAMARVNKVLEMNARNKSMKLITFGFEEWNKFDDLDIQYRNNSNQHFASYRFFDYDSPRGIAFVKAFRNACGTDPNVYSCQGFDYGMYFLSALYLYGTNFDDKIGTHKMELTQNEFKFKAVESGSGQENQHVCIVMYDKYKLIRLK